MAMKRTWAFVGTGAVAAAAASAVAWSLSGPAVAGATGLAALAAALGGAAFMRAARAAQASEKASAELDGLSRRLLRIESRLADVERQPLAETRKTVAEVSGEIALLSGLLRDLAATVSGHDRDVATLAEEIVALRERASPQAAAATGARDASSGWARGLEDIGPQAFAPEAGPPQARSDERARDGLRRADDSPDASMGADPAEGLDAMFEPPSPVRDPAEEARRRAILQAFRDDRIEIHLQPIVSLPQRKTKFYEALARLRLADDTLAAPADFLPVLEEAKLAPELDGKVAARAAAVARHLVNRGGEAFVTCNLSPASVRTPGFLRALGRILEAYPDVLGRLAFEISQRCWRTLEAETAGALEQLRRKGAFFVMDRATDLRLDPLSLADRGVAYVKLPVRMLLDPQPSHGLDFEAADLATVLARAGVRLIAEKVEFEHDVPDLIDIDAPLAQGFVFAPPRAVRGDIVGGAGGQPRKSAPAGAGSAAAPKAAQAGAAPSANLPGQPSAARDPAGRDGGARKPRAPGSDASPAKRESKETLGSNDQPEPRLPYRAFLRRAG